MNDIYTQINELFDEMKREGSRPSITQIAKKLGVSEERVRRTLITEGKWKSKTSAEVMQLFQKQYTVSQIAEALCISEKNVQSYLPYSRGMYGGEQTIEAERCGQYRARMKSAEEKMNNPERKATEMKEINRPATFLEYEAEKGNENAREAVQKWYQKLESIRLETEQLWDRMKSAEMAECIQLANENQAYVQARRGVYQLRLELSSGSGDGKPDRLGMDEADWQKFLKLANAKEGISRTILVPGNMHLHALHYLIQRLFGWQNSHLHRFGLTDADFQRVTAGRLGGWLDLCGTLFRMDSEDFGDIYWDDDYKQGQSVKTWFRKKYMPPYRSLAVTDTFLYNLNRSQEFERRLASNEREGMTPFTRDDLIEEFVRRMHPEFDMNTLLQRIRIQDLFIEEGAFGEDSVSERLGLWHLLEKGERGFALEEWEKNSGKNKARKERLLRKLKDLLILRENINECERGVRYGNEERIRKQIGMSPEEYILEVLDFCRLREWHFQLYSDDVLYYAEANRHSQRYEDAQKVKGQAVGWDGLRKHMEQVTKLLLISDSLEETDERIGILRSEFGQKVAVMRSNPHYAEIVNHGVSKASGIERLADELGIDIRDTMAIGDSDNDLPMLKAAGCSVAMGNALPHVKDACDYVTGECEADGFAEAVRRYVLQDV